MVLPQPCSLLWLRGLGKKYGTFSVALASFLLKGGHYRMLQAPGLCIYLYSALSGAQYTPLGPGREVGSTSV